MHNINFNKQKNSYSFASSSDPAWHGLGQSELGKMPWRVAVEKANLDFKVEMCNICGESESGKTLHHPDIKGTFRADTKELLGIVGNRYKIVQNEDCFLFFDNLIDADEAIFETAGVLGRGERIFATAKLGSDFEVAGEPCSNYVLLTNSHDGKSSIIACLTPIRVVCANTLHAALSKCTNKLYIKHDTSAKERLAEAHNLMKISSIYTKEIQSVFEEMAKKSITDDALKAYIMDVISNPVKEELSEDEKKEISTRMQNKATDIFNFTKSHPTQTTKAAEGTLWGAYNGISGYFNHAENFKSQEHKFNSIMFGAANKRIIKSFNLGLEMLNS